MTRTRIIALAGVTASLFGLPAASAAADDAPHFTMQKTNDGFVRMNTRTGEMSFCQEQSGHITCRDGQGEDGASLRHEVEKLKRRVDALERRLDRLEGQEPEGRADTLPDEREFEKSLDYMDRFFQHFMGVMKDFQDEYGREPPRRPPADVPEHDHSRPDQSKGDQPPTKL
jgi:hypothetical protein